MKYHPRMVCRILNKWYNLATNMFLQNLIDRLENWLANKVAQQLTTMDAQATRKATISAIVTRADGRVEDLGVISTSEVSMVKFSWKNLFRKLFN